MTINFPGPCGLRIFYSVDGREHKMEFNFDPVDAVLTPGEPFAGIEAVSKGGSNSNLADYIDDVLMPLIQPFYDDTLAAFDRAEVWQYTPGTYQATFISAYSIGLPGTDDGSVIPAAEQIWTFRSAEGGIMRVHFEEPNTLPGASVGYGAMGAVGQAFVDAFLADENVFLARDTSYPIAFMRQHPGQNEAVWKLIYRN